MEALTSTERPIVGLALEAPPHQVRRATVAFRIILAIPHLLWSLVLGLVVTITMIVAWFAALFTGRLPESLADFVGRVLQYMTRVYAYMYLLTDEYPPFSLDATDYPVEVLLPPRGRLNRAAVLFRFILAIPAGIVATVVSTGLQPVLVVVWLITLVSGRLPRSAFEAEAAALRYQTRFYAWLMMLTSEYPRALFGDPPLSGSAPAPATDGSPIDFLRSEQGPEETAIPAPPPVPGAIPPPPPVVASPRITTLVLSNPGRRLMVTFIVLGAILTVAQIVVSIVASAASSEARQALDDAYHEVVAASEDYGVAVQTCALDGTDGGPACVAEANAEFAEEVRAFAAQLEEIEFPDSTLDEADELRDDALATADLLDRLGEATSDPDAYNDLLPDFQMLTEQLDDRYRDLRDELLFA